MNNFYKLIIAATLTSGIVACGGGSSEEGVDITDTDGDTTVLTPDTSSPVVTINSLSVANTENQANYTVSGSCDSGDGDVSVTITGIVSDVVTCNNDIWTVSLNVSSILDGSNAITANATQTDTAGNIGSASQQQADKDSNTAIVIASINQKTQPVTMPAHIAPTGQWVQRANGLCGAKCRNGPRQMYTAAFGDKLLVSWMAKTEGDAWHQYGNVATFTVGLSGDFIFEHNVSFENTCAATYGITTSVDGSTIAVLCRGIEGQTDLVDNAIDLLATRYNESKSGCPASAGGGSWQGRCYPIGNYSEIDSALYLMEYTNAEVKGQPSSMVRINHAIGGWNYGHHELSLNAAEDTYFVNIKVTAGPSISNRHEGLTHFAVQRPSAENPDFSYKIVTDGWSCGSGHVLANRIAYNKHHDTWGGMCSRDVCSMPSQFTAGGACKSLSFTTIPGVTKPALVEHKDLSGLMDFGQFNGKQWVHNGGLGASFLSLGTDGWLALATGPDTIGLLPMPLTTSELSSQLVNVDVPIYDGEVETGRQSVQRGNWNWLEIPAAEDVSRSNRPGMANMAYFGTEGENSTQLLVGWTPTMATQGIASEYVVSMINRQGQLQGTPYVLQNAGWGENNRWVTMPNSGCVVFPFSWEGSAPGGNYSIVTANSVASDYPLTMYMTSLCPGS